MDDDVASNAQAPSSGRDGDQAGVGGGGEEGETIETETRRVCVYVCVFERLGDRAREGGRRS